MDSDWFKDLFISEAKNALNAQGGGTTPAQIESAVTDYLDKNPIRGSTPSASVKNNILVIE